MSLLQRTEVYQKAGHNYPAFGPGGFINSGVSEVTETDEDVFILNVSGDVLERAAAANVLILNVPDLVLERAAGAADRHVIKEYVDSKKWCGDQRTKYAVVKVEATSFVLAVICVTLAFVLVSVMFPNEFSLIGP